MNLPLWLYVFLGGGLGASLRYGIVRAMAPLVQTSFFPWAIFAINVTGSFLLGLLLGLTQSQGSQPDPGSTAHQWRLFLGTGVLGGYTTFSTLSADTMVLMQNHKLGLALANSAGSLLLGVFSAFLGWHLALKLRA